MNVYMDFFHVEFIGSNENFEILSRNFSLMPRCKFKELLHTEDDVYLKSEF
jgi:hypothetical protein